jgi:hypothetical protein
MTRPVARRALPAALAALLLALPAAALDRGTPWLHVRVDDPGADGAHVRVNLPLALVEAVVAILPRDAGGEARIVIGDGEMTVAELRRQWRELGRRGRPLEVRDDEQLTRLQRRGDRLVIETRDLDRPGERTRVQISSAVVEALLSGHGERLDLAAAVRALADAGSGTVLALTEDGGRVEIWVDRVPDPEG